MFFIVGVGRSGTSLLQSILSSHSQICIPPETGFLRNNIFTLQNNSEITFEEVFTSNKRLERFISPSFRKRLPERYSNKLEFYKILIKNYKKEQDKRIAGDKDPRLVEYICGLSLIFSEAKFIHLVRDPRDILLSKKRAGWSTNKPAWYHIFANYVQLKIGEYSGGKLSANEYFVITYEEILKTPESTISEICKFLEVGFEPSMLSFQDKAKELVASDERQWKKETMGPLLKENTGKWQGELDHWEVALTEILCDRAFKIGKYGKSDLIKRLSFLGKLRIYILAFTLMGLGRVYIIYRILHQKIVVKWKF